MDAKRIIIETIPGMTSSQQEKVRDFVQQDCKIYQNNNACYFNMRDLPAETIDKVYEYCKSLKDPLVELETRSRDLGYYQTFISKQVPSSITPKEPDATPSYDILDVERRYLLHQKKHVYKKGSVHHRITQIMKEKKKTKKTEFTATKGEYTGDENGEYPSAFDEEEDPEETEEQENDEEVQEENEAESEDESVSSSETLLEVEDEDEDLINDCKGFLAKRGFKFHDYIEEEINVVLENCKKYLLKFGYKFKINIDYVVPCVKEDYLY
jgi:hypothetical protein